MPQRVQSPLTSFYSGKTVLLTGATGCVGKVLLEKLLFTCRDVRCVYVLVREKNGSSASQRVKNLIKSRVFSGANRIPHNVLKDKIVPLYGDLTVQGLGLSEQDKDIVLDEVDIVLHCATCARPFDDPVKEALKFNFLGTRSLVQLANEMSKIEAFVHVSTCYSNCQLDVIEEKVYPMNICGDELVQMSRWLKSDDLDEMAKEGYFEGRLNSYVFATALAEVYVHDHSKCPTAIARLSTVLPSLEEPEPGFVELSNEIASLRPLNSNASERFDALPVDTVVNGLLAIGHDVATAKPSKPKVYNVCSGLEVSLSPKLSFEASSLVKQLDMISSNLLCPASPTRSPSNLYHCKEYILEYISALVIDTVLVLKRQKSFALKALRLEKNVRADMEAFYSKTFEFKNKNFIALSKRMNPIDSELFNIDLNRISAVYSSISKFAEYYEKLQNFNKNFKSLENQNSADESATTKHQQTLRARNLIHVLAVQSLSASLLFAAFVSLRFAYNIYLT